MSFEKSKKKIIEKMFDKYGYHFCENCGRSDKPIDVHHIIFRSEAPHHKKLHDPVNLLIVCRDCHDLAHGDKDKFRNKIVKQRGLKQIFTNIKNYE